MLLRIQAMVSVGLVTCLLAGCGGDQEPSLSERLANLPSGESSSDSLVDTIAGTASPAVVDEEEPIPDTVPGLSFDEARVDPEPTADEWTAGIIDEENTTGGSATLQAVRVGRNAGFDRIVLEFDGESLPGYHIEYIDRPVRRCGSGHITTLAGDAWLQIRMSPTRAHTEAGEATIPERKRNTDLPVIREIKMVCDFEGNVEWVLGVASPNPYRVLELSEPARLVVDVRH